jgi:hypothetical protein
VHGRAVNAKDSKFTVEELRGWKRQTNKDSRRSVMDNVPYGPDMRTLARNELMDRLRQ